MTSKFRVNKFSILKLIFLIECKYSYVWNWSKICSFKKCPMSGEIDINKKLLVTEI